MIVRLTSINGSRDSPDRITWLEKRDTHSDSEIICARVAGGN